VKRGIAIALSALVLGSLVACSKDRDHAATADASAPSPSAATSVATTAGVISSDEAYVLVRNGCLSCHTGEMIAQQRLTPAQWGKVVTKMVGWGANLEPGETAPLTTWLSATYGVDAGPYTPSRIGADAAAEELAQLPDGPFANGDAERGRPLYVDKCSGCHGAEAKGHIGTILVDRPFLYRAADFAMTIRRGRGKMTPLPLSDAEIADILAHLRRLKNP
jgi:mono/diheme cytochrome c family protein